MDSFVFMTPLPSCGHSLRGPVHCFLSTDHADGYDAISIPHKWFLLLHYGSVNGRLCRFHEIGQSKENPASPLFIYIYIYSRRLYVYIYIKGAGCGLHCECRSSNAQSQIERLLALFSLFLILSLSPNFFYFFIFSSMFASCRAVNKLTQGVVSPRSL